MDYGAGRTIRRAASAHGGATTRRFGQRKTMRQLEPERHGRGRSFHGSSRSLGRGRQKAPPKNPVGGSPAGRRTQRPRAAVVPRPLAPVLPRGSSDQRTRNAPER